MKFFLVFMMLAAPSMSSNAESYFYNKHDEWISRYNQLIEAKTTYLYESFTYNESSDILKISQNPQGKIRIFISQIGTNSVCVGYEFKGLLNVKIGEYKKNVFANCDFRTQHRPMLSIGLPGKDRNEIAAAISKATKATFGDITFSLKGSNSALKDIELRLAK